MSESMDFLPAGMCVTVPLLQRRGSISELFIMATRQDARATLRI